MQQKCGCFQQDFYVLVKLCFRKMAKNEVYFRCCVRGCRKECSIGKEEFFEKAG
jgi:hypothetical protein